MSARFGRGRRARGSRRFSATLDKAQGVIQPCVPRVGSGHFGVVSVDCAEGRFNWILPNFYGTVHIAQNRFRVFYQIDRENRQVRIVAIGEKGHNRLFVGGEEVTL